MPDLLLGPLLRYVSDTEATIWVETDTSCEATALGASTPTFEVAGHHYALIRVEGLEPGSTNPYTVELDGVERWPEPGSELPPSVVHTLGDGPLDIRFGSCRVSLPHEPPYTHSADKTEEGHEIDALYVLAEEMVRTDPAEWPDQLFLLGDQVYVDEGAPRTREKIRESRGVGTEPGDEVTDFEEYTWLYQESWSEPLIRWLFSTVSLSMLWDDHDMSDDWNISGSWVEEMHERAWWQRRLSGCVASYWIYQHLGNLSPQTLDQDEVYAIVRGGGDVSDELREWADGVSKTGSGTRWSFCRDFGGTRAIFVDSRAGRTFDGARRQMVDDEEWEWISARAEGDFDHLLIATTVPWILSPGFQALEAWNEKVCAGAWGRPLDRAAELLRREVDFDHWGSFGESFAKLRDLMGEVARGEHGARPASVVVLSGDVHHAYLAEVGYPANGESGEVDGVPRAPVYQAVCSPYRNPLSTKERAVIKAGFGRPFTAVSKLLARAAGAPDPGIRWRTLEGPCFDNQVAMLRVDGRRLEMRLDKTVPDDEDESTLRQSFERRLA